MNFEDYLIQTQRTLPDLTEKLGPLANTIHMTMGIEAENYELLIALHKQDTTNVTEELGDKMWYASNYIHVNNLSDDFDKDVKMLIGSKGFIDYNSNVPDELIPSVYINSKNKYEHQDVIAIMGGFLLDMDKKAFAYGKSRNRDYMLSAVENFFIAMHNTCLMFNFNIKHIMKNNIAKLYVRYPDKFNEKDAVIRDLKKERETLEK